MYARMWVMMQDFVNSGSNVLSADHGLHYDMTLKGGIPINNTVKNLLRFGAKCLHL